MTTSPSPVPARVPDRAPATAAPDPPAHRFNIGRTFIRGFIVLLPVIVTIYLLAAIIMGMEASLGALIKLAIPGDRYFPGLGVAAAIAFIFVFGVFLQAWTVRQVVRLTERGLERVPVVKSIYTATRDMMAYFRKTKKEEMSKVVLVTLGESYQVIGLMTRQDVSDLPLDPGRKLRLAAVFIPMSYNLGGYTIFIPRSAVKVIDMSFEDALRFALTGGVGGDRQLIEEELQAIEEEIVVAKEAVVVAKEEKAEAKAEAKQEALEIKEAAAEKAAEI